MRRSVRCTSQLISEGEPRHGERFYKAELYRLKGELMLQKFQVPRERRRHCWKNWSEIVTVGERGISREEEDGRANPRFALSGIRSEPTENRSIRGFRRVSDPRGQ